MTTNDSDSVAAPKARAASQRIAVFSLLTAGYLLALYFFFRPVQRAIQNDISGLNLFTMTYLVAPFMVVRIVVSFQQRFTRYAWILCAIMALDVVFFAGAEFGILGGHPSLGSVLSMFLGMAKCVLIPAALVLLGLACLKGERLFVVVLGFLCLTGETLYAYYMLPR
jgi:hypothetical protein